jgi:cell division protein FtsB
MVERSTHRAENRQPGRGAVARRPRASARTRRAAPSSLRVNWLRLALLALVLIAAALYVGPLREFFAQQDRYQREVATLEQLKQQNVAYERLIAEIHTKAWVLRTAREDFQLVPPGTQPFVITGLPGDEETPVTTGTPSAQSLSLPQRLKDLWETLLQ